MRITDVKHFAPTVGMRPQSIVKIETDAGISGLGEAGTAGRERAVGGMFDHYREILIGKDPRRIEDIHQVLYRSQYFEGGTVITAAASAIDIALWDILGQHLDTPIWQLLGGASRQRVACFADAIAGEGATMPERAADLAAKGWGTIRFTPVMPTDLDPDAPEDVYEPWESVVATAEMLHAVRARVGSKSSPGGGFSSPSERCRRRRVLPAGGRHQPDVPGRADQVREPGRLRRTTDDDGHSICHRRGILGHLRSSRRSSSAA